MAYLLNDGSLSETKPKFQSRTLYIRPQNKFGTKKITQQQFKDECDINRIMKRYETTGQLPDMIKSDPVYGDFSSVPTFLDALNTVNLAETQVAALSSKIRAQFDNDPAQFLAFATDPKNNSELVKMGLAELPATTPPTPTEKALNELNTTLKTQFSTPPKGKTSVSE